MSSPEPHAEPVPSPEHGTTTTTALTLAQSALGDQDDGEEARGSYRRTAVVSRVRRIILLHVLLIELPFVRLLYYVYNTRIIRCIIVLCVLCIVRPCR